jgi:prevent-host-death family protein
VTQEEPLRELSVREIRAALPQLEQVLEQEGELVITRHGTPMARVLPPAPQQRIPSRADLRPRMRRVAVASEVLIREDRDARG